MEGDGSEAGESRRNRKSGRVAALAAVSPPDLDRVGGEGQKANHRKLAHRWC